MGNAPVSVIGVGVGNPVVVTVNVPAGATVNVVVSALVIAGAWSTREREALRGVGSTPLAAVIVSA